MSHPGCLRKVTTKGISCLLVLRLVVDRQIHYLSSAGSRKARNHFKDLKEERFDCATPLLFLLSSDLPLSIPSACFSGAEDDRSMMLRGGREVIAVGGKADLWILSDTKSLRSLQAGWGASDHLACTYRRGRSFGAHKLRNSEKAKLGKASREQVALSWQRAPWSKLAFIPLCHCCR